MIYPDGQSVLSYLRVEPFGVLFGALGIVLVLQKVTQPAGLASLNRGTGMVLYCAAAEIMLNLTNDASAPALFPSNCIIYLLDFLNR